MADLAAASWAEDEASTVAEAMARVRIFQYLGFNFSGCGVQCHLPPPPPGSPLVSISPPIT